MGETDDRTESSFTYGRIRKIPKSDSWLHISPFAQKNSAPGGQIFTKFDP